MPKIQKRLMGPQGEGAVNRVSLKLSLPRVNCRVYYISIESYLVYIVPDNYAPGSWSYSRGIFRLVGAVHCSAPESQGS